LNRDIIIYILNITQKRKKIVILIIMIRYRNLLLDLVLYMFVD